LDRVNCVLAVDVGASKVAASVFRMGSPAGIIEEPASQGVEAAVEKAARRAVAGADCEPRLVGVASVGPLDYGGPAIVGAPNLAEGRASLARPLEWVGAPIIVGNDAVASLWAEAVLGKARGLSDAAMVVMGTGVGGAAIVSGRLVLGRRGGAHEVGHIVVDYGSNLKCGCGGRGHWEAIAGGRWLPRLVLSLARGGEPLARLARLGRLTASTLAAALEQGDGLAEEAYKVVVAATAAGLASVAAVYDPEVVYMAGGVVEALGARFLRDVAAKAGEYSLYEVRIEEASFGRLQALYGAYAIAYRPPPELLALNTHPWAPRGV